MNIAHGGLIRRRIGQSSLDRAPAPRESPRSQLLFVVRRFRLAAVVLALLWPLSACTSWQSLPAPETGFGRDTDHVRVKTDHGTRLDVWYPRLQGDSLLGASSRDRKDGTDVRLGNVRTLKIERISAVDTAFLIVGVGGVVALIIFAATFKPFSGFGPISCGPC